MSAIDPYRLKISQLRALVAIAETGRFSEAALQIELSQSAVSHAVATWEAELGVVLLQRGRNGATLTPIGEQVLSEARQVLQLLEGIANKAQIARGLRGGKVRVASFRSVDTHILPPIIARFRKTFPEIEVSISEYKFYDEVEKDLPVPLERVVGVAVLANTLHPPSVFAFLNTLKQESVYTPQPPLPAEKDYHPHHNG